MPLIQRLIQIICSIIIVCAPATTPVAVTPVATGSANMEAVSPTPTIHPDLAPLTITALRSRSYPATTLTPESEEVSMGSYTSQIVSYRSDGYRIYAQLTRPTAPVPAGGYPAVVFVHGYIPPREYTTLGKYVAYVDSLARSGIVVLKIDLRGHGQSEGQPSGAYYSTDYVVDTLSAYASLRGLDGVDPSRVALWGHSMAGNVVMRAAVVQRDIPQVVIWAGAVYSYADMLEYGIQDASYQPGQNPNRNRGQSIRELAGEVTGESRFWREFAPTNYLSDLQGTHVSIHHSTDDPVVSVEYSRNLARLLERSSVPHELYEYDTGGHNISSPSYETAMQRTIDKLVSE